MRSPFLDRDRTYVRVAAARRAVPLAFPVGGPVRAAALLVGLYVPYAAMFGDPRHATEALVTFGGLLATALVAARSRPTRALGQFVLAAWPVAWWPVLYGQAVAVIQLARSRYVDPDLWAFDAALFGWGAAGPPTSWLGGPAEELANLFYVSYYVGVPLGLLVAWRRGPASATRYANAILSAFAVCAVVWLLVPSGGPHLSGGPTTPAWGPFTAIARAIYAANPHHAAAFPSSHAAVAFAAGVALMRTRPTPTTALGRIAGLAPVAWAFGVAYGTVAGQYHYSLDAVVGAIVGAVAAVGATSRAPRRVRWSRTRPTRPTFAANRGERAARAALEPGRDLR